MVWDALNLFFGIVCIIGPLALIVWYFKAAKVQLENLNKSE